MAVDVHTRATGPVLGTSWRRHPGRRQRAARIARTLRPAAQLLGGVVSTELIVPFGDRWYRPDVGVVAAEDDVADDGVVTAATQLVVCLGGPLTPRQWLSSGARVVWAVADGGAQALTRRGVQRVAADAWLVHPDEPSLRLAVAHLAPDPPADARARA